jgi:hypothetical protein
VPNLSITIRIFFIVVFQVNLYPAGEGLRAHVDLPRFDDGIVSVSLAAPCVMTYAPVHAGGELQQQGGRCSRATLCAQPLVRHIEAEVEGRERVLARCISSKRKEARPLSHALTSD